MSAINNYSAQINARRVEIVSRIQAGDLEEARRLIARPVCYTGPLAAASTETIYLSNSEQAELMDRIKTLAANNLAPSRTYPRTHLLTKQAKELPDSFPKGKLPAEVVSLIASYEDKNVSLDRLKALFNFFCQSFSSKDPVAVLPYDISLSIFSYLNKNEIGRSCEVSKGWSTFASDPIVWNALDLKKIFPLLKVFDESDWVTHVDLSSFGLTVEDAPPFDKRTEIAFLKRRLSSLQIEGNAGVTYLTLPKGLTLNKLVKLAASPKVGNVTKFWGIDESVLKEIGEIAVPQTYRIVITNNVFKGLRKIAFFKLQEHLVNQIGCRVPRGLEVVALLVVTFMRSGEHFYYIPWPGRVCTRCSEEIGSQRGHMIVEYFMPREPKNAGVLIDIEVRTWGDSEFYSVGGVLQKL